MSKPRLIITRKTTHLAAAQAETLASLVSRAHLTETACGRKVDGITGTHEAGSLPAGLCKNCRRTELYRTVAAEWFRTEHAAEIAQAESYVRSRFFPPLPAEYGELAVRAVHAVNDGDPYRRFDVGHLNPEPRGTGPDGKVTAARLVEVLRLSHLIDDDAADIAYLD